MNSKFKILSEIISSTKSRYLSFAKILKDIIKTKILDNYKMIFIFFTPALMLSIFAYMGANQYKPEELPNLTPTQAPVFIPPTEQTRDNLTIIAMGDIYLSSAFVERLMRLQFTDIFKQFIDNTIGRDIIFGNLEGPITIKSADESKTNTPNLKKALFYNDPTGFEWIKKAHVNLLSLANDHMYDSGTKGIQNTINILNKNNIYYSGITKDSDSSTIPAIFYKNNIKIGMLSYTDNYEIKVKPENVDSKTKYGITPIPMFYSKQIDKDIKNLRKNVDLLIVSLHWGDENSYITWPGQIEFAHKLIDNGVDAIFGTYPRLFQGIEVYKGKPIFYSLGNFIFNVAPYQDIFKNTFVQNENFKKYSDLQDAHSESFMVELDYRENSFISLSATPVKFSLGAIRIQYNEDAAPMLKREAALCNKLGTKCTITNNRLIFDMNNSK